MSNIFENFGESAGSIETQALGNFLTDINSEISSLEGDQNLKNQITKESEIHTATRNLTKNTLINLMNQMFIVDDDFGDNNKVDLIADFLVEDVGVTGAQGAERALMALVRQAKQEKEPVKGVDLLLATVLKNKARSHVG